MYEAVERIRCFLFTGLAPGVLLNFGHVARDNRDARNVTQLRASWPLDYVRWIHSSIGRRFSARFLCQRKSSKSHCFVISSNIGGQSALHYESKLRYFSYLLPEVVPNFKVTIKNSGSHLHTAFRGYDVGLCVFLRKQRGTLR